jgi:hypothetical protein
MGFLEKLLFQKIAFETITTIVAIKLPFLKLPWVNPFYNWLAHYLLDDGIAAFQTEVSDKVIDHDALEKDETYKVSITEIRALQSEGVSENDPRAQEAIEKARARVAELHMVRYGKHGVQSHPN